MTVRTLRKPRVVAHQNLVRSFGGMFLQEPHRTTKTYRLLSAKVGKEMFCEGDRLEPYYLAALALVKLEYLTIDLLMLLKAVGEHKAAFLSLGDQWADTTTAAGRLMLRRFWVGSREDRANRFIWGPVSITDREGPTLRMND